MQTLGKFCPFLNKDCIETKCMLFDEVNKVCSIKSCAVNLQKMVLENDYLDEEDDDLDMGFDDDNDDFIDAEDESTQEEPGDSTIAPENN